MTFTKDDGSMGIVTPDGCNCIAEYTTPIPNVVDPNTGEIGYGCQLTAKGQEDMLFGNLGVIYGFYYEKSLGRIDCYSPYSLK